jgi:hypothetical protein
MRRLPALRACPKNLRRLGDVGLRDLAQLLDREQLSLQNSYVKELLKDGELGLKYPDRKQHPQQAYRTKGTSGA